jgi:hypothetical protein
MGGRVEFDTITSTSLRQGNNEYEQGVINIGADATVKAGTLLARDGDKFSIAEAAADIIAVVPDDLTNSSNVAADIGFRALIGGSVRGDLINFNGDPITKAEADCLRDYGIIVVNSTDLSRVNP